MNKVYFPSNKLSAIRQYAAINDIPIEEIHRVGGVLIVFPNAHEATLGKLAV